MRVEGLTLALAKDGFVKRVQFYINRRLNKDTMAKRIELITHNLNKLYPHYSLSRAKSGKIIKT